MRAAGGVGRACDFTFVPAGSLADATSLVQLGESLGYRCAWLPDQAFTYEPFSLLAVCAVATSRIGLGLAVASPFVHHSVQLARAAATLDELSGGRFRLGLGTGNVSSFLEPLGIAPRASAATMRETIRTVQRLLAGEIVTFPGGTRSVRLDVVPQGRVPIYVGARAPLMLSVAGELADGVLLNSLVTDEALSYMRRCLRAGAATSGRRPDELDVVAGQILVVTSDAPTALERQRPWAARLIVSGPRDVMSVIGIDPDVVDEVVCIARAQGYDAAASHVTDDAVRRLAIVGDANEVRSEIERVLDGGASSICLLLTGTQEEMRDTLTSFARDVAFPLDTTRNPGREKR